MKKLIIPLTAALVIAGCNNSKQEPQELKEQKKIVVTTAVATSRSYHPELIYSGTAHPYREANLGTTLPGRVEKIHFQEGDFVKKDQLIVELSAELYAQALAEKNTLEKDYERLQRLKKKGSVSQQKYDHVKAKYEAAKAKARMMKKNCEIRAPFSGTIVDYLVEEGENFMFSPSLQPGYSHTSGVVKIMQLNKLKIKIKVNEKDLPKIKTGQQVKILFDAFPDSPFKGIVDKIKPILSTATRTGEVEIRINNFDKKIKPGMYAKAFIQLPETTNVFIPINSIYRQPGTGNNYVFVVQNKTVSKKPIQKLYTRGENVAVKGVRNNVKVVVHGKNKLNDGDQVIIK